ncbi:MAG: hypothetical protein J7L96_04875 [Bacteroidales bacterium]|nr:hypothetical protein [Bacteroidales bacterium]
MGKEQSFIRQENINITMTRLTVMNIMQKISSLTLIIGLVLVVSSCNKKPEKEIISRWPDGEVKKVYSFKQNGELREKVLEERFYENGNREMRGEFKNGVRNGDWIYWFEDGRKWTKSKYDNDLRVGHSIVWRENGFKNYEGMYSKGKPHGSWIFYDVDGSRVKEVLFEYGTKLKEIDYKEGVPFQLQHGDSARFKVN